MGKKKLAQTFQICIVEQKIAKLQTVYEVDCETLEKISTLTNKAGWNIRVNHKSLPNCS